MFARTLLTLAVLSAPAAVQADEWQVGSGLEDYHWVEFPQATRSPEEDGMRAALFVNWMQSGEQGALWAWHGKMYGGSVSYDTYLISNGEPITTKTDYGGANSEAQWHYRTDLAAHKLDYIGGLGLDVWRRSISSVGGNQIEDYMILFARAGMGVVKSEKEVGMHGEFGVKYPLATREDAHLNISGYTSNPQLYPVPLVSAYVEFGYSLPQGLDLVAYIDTWRFNRSPSVSALDAAGTTWTIHQPQSNMDAMGIKLLVSF
jgi:hypothetical protein